MAPQKKHCAWCPDNYKSKVSQEEEEEYFIPVEETKATDSLIEEGSH